MGCGAGRNRRYSALANVGSGLDLESPRAAGLPVATAASAAKGDPASHLSCLPTRSVLRLARQVDAAAARQCLERRELEELLLARLGAPAAQRRAYEERPDVREALVLSSTVGRLVREVRALLAAVEERRQFLQACLEAELSLERPCPDECGGLTAALAEAADHGAAVQCVLEDAEEAAAALAEKVEQGHEQAPGRQLEPVNEMADSVLSMLSTLASAALTLGDFHRASASTARPGGPPPDGGRAPPAPQGGGGCSVGSVEGQQSATGRGGSTARIAALREIAQQQKQQRQQDAAKRRQLLAERERLVQKVERVVQRSELREEGEVLQEEHAALWAELEELEKERDIRETNFQAYDCKERAALKTENASLARELEEQLAAMGRALDALEEQREVQVSKMRQRKVKLELEGFDEEASVSMTWAVNADGTLRHGGAGMEISTDADITYERREYKLSPDDIELEGGSQLGAGAGGVVSQGVIKSTGERVAVKTIRMDDRCKREQLLNEIKGLIHAEGCPYLVQWYAGFASKLTGSVHVVLELMDLGSLADLRRALKGHGVPHEHLACIAKQIMEGLSYLHGKRLLHRDIKPQNILHNRRGQVKLTDFGLSKGMSTAFPMAETFVGTLIYMSPERCLGQDYDLRSDVWSAGLVLYELATGEYPFLACSSFPALFVELCEKPEPRLRPEDYPPDLCGFVERCLSRDVSQRPGALELLGHDFLSNRACSGEALAAWLAALA